MGLESRKEFWLWQNSLNQPAILPVAVLFNPKW
jgi:hypothetical protein